MKKRNEGEKVRYLVLVPLVLSAVSPLRKARPDGLRRDFANLIMLVHCCGVAKFGKYTALGFQLKTYNPESAK